MAHGMLLSLRLFLEGVEVDVVSAQVSGGLNQPAQAQIEIPNAVAASGLLPRTLVHLFFMQTQWEVDEVGASASRADVNDPRQWKLLFAGEVVSMSFAKAGGSRTNYLICQDFSSYWQAAQLYWGTGNNSFNAYKKVIMMGASQLTTGATKVQSGGALADLLAAKPTTIPALSGVLGGIVSLLEASTGVYGKSGKYRGVNDFMSQAEVRLHLTRMIAAHPDDDTSSVFLRYGDLSSYFRRLTSAVRGTATFMDLTATFLSKIHHSWASVLAPPFVASGSAATVKQLVYIKNPKKDSDTELSKWVERIQNTRDALGRRFEEMTKEEDASIKATGKAVINYSSESSKKFAEELQKAALVDGVPPAAQDKVQGYVGNQVELGKVSVAVANNAKTAASKRTLVNVTGGLAKAAEAIDDLRLMVTQKDGVFKEQTTTRVTETQLKLEAALASIKTGSNAATKVVTTSTTIDSRLNMFLFMPDLYMVPPPKCNVLFPDHYMSVQFSRSWLTEVTRLWMFGQTTAGSETSVGYFSPNTSILKGPKAADAATAAQEGLSFLMRHEIFTGPVPAIEALGDIAVFKKNHAGQVAASKSNSGNKVGDPTGSEIAGQARYSAQEHLQRAANYLFFAKRFEGRTITISAKFSPQVIPGLPMLVLDPPVGMSSLQTGEVSVPEQRGQHYVGLVASVSHSISPNGAGTTITLVKCRYHNEGLDLFAQDGREVDPDTGVLDYKKRIVKYVPAKKRPHKGILVQPITNERPSTSREILDYMARAERPGAEYIEESKEYGTTDLGREAVTTVYKHPKTGHKVTVQLKTVVYGGRTGQGSNLVDAPDTPFTGASRQDEAFAFGAPVEFEVTTLSDAKKAVSSKDLSFTFEATATPPWFASIYLPSKVGNAYYQVIAGCGSVVDDALFASDTNEGDTLEISVPTANGSTVVKIPAEYALPAVSTHDAAEQLADVWKGLKETNANVPLFVDNYTARKYANMVDILGTENPWLRTKSGLPDEVLANPVEGFHGNAYGNITGMRKYDGNALEEAPTIPRLSPRGIKPPTLRTISPDADPRQARYNAVVRYVAEISRLRSSLGG